MARLRWTHIVDKKTRNDWGSSDSDAKIAEALKKKPSRSDPPKPYKGTKQNHGRYLHVDGDDLVCMGYEPLPGAPDCEDTCEGEVCISAKNGPVKLSGTWAPGNSIFESATAN